MSRARPSVLVVAGTESSGRAGLARDLATLRDHGVDAQIAVTAITAQNDQGLRAQHFSPPEIVAAQLAQALHEPQLRAIKIGMLGNQAIVETLCEALARRPDLPVVLDPVLNATSGAPLLDAAGLQMLKTRLLPLCRLITPNLPELARLCDTDLPQSTAKQCDLARHLHRMGGAAVLLKGGHATGSEAVDLLVDGTGRALRFAAPRLAISARGTGCTLASAISANLAQGHDLPEAVGRAKTYLSDWLTSLTAPRQGQ